jgi:hypothetical protein
MDEITQHNNLMQLSLIFPMTCVCVCVHARDTHDGRGIRVCIVCVWGASYDNAAIMTTLQRQTSYRIVVRQRQLLLHLLRR